MLKSLKNNEFLFLDRDGVINERIIGGYIIYYKDFYFKEGVLEALKIFNKHFKRIFIVTNQQCIGKGLIKEMEFTNLTNQMLEDISLNGGRIDKVYYCPNLKTDKSPFRKPDIGMGLQAQKEYPEVDFSKSIMVGDSNSDMIFGKRLGMTTVFVDNLTGEDYDESLIDYKCSSLIEFAENFK
ncbi:MAG: HAD-IIIA family hydrolase [Bacteroidales bacterium]|nr:HAD-IIIA family hydrolase [Bacteroidales bacterium]